MRVKIHVLYDHQLGMGKPLIRNPYERPMVEVPACEYLL